MADRDLAMRSAALMALVELRALNELDEWMQPFLRDGPTSHR